jgi:hypothetical protein
MFLEPTNSATPPWRTLWYGARTVDDLIVVDAGLWNPGCVRQRRRFFLRTQALLGTRLTNAFGQRVVSIEKYADRIPTESIEKKP